MQDGWKPTAMARQILKCKHRPFISSFWGSTPTKTMRSQSATTKTMKNQWILSQYLEVAGIRDLVAQWLKMGEFFEKPLKLKRLN